MTSDSSARRDSLENADRCARRKAGTATNSRFWNWLAVPGLPPPKGFRISADYPSVRGGMPEMETKNFGQISFEPDSELEFPTGLPGFDSRRRFVAVRFAESDPLVFLQSLADPEFYSITLQILAPD